MWIQIMIQLCSNHTKDQEQKIEVLESVSDDIVPIPVRSPQVLG